MVAKLRSHELLTLRLSTEELAMLTVIAEADGRDKEDVLRSYILVDYECRFGTTVRSDPDAG